MRGKNTGRLSNQVFARRTLLAGNHTNNQPTAHQRTLPGPLPRLLATVPHTDPAPLQQPQPTAQRTVLRPFRDDPRQTHLLVNKTNDPNGLADSKMPELVLSPSLDMKHNPPFLVCERWIISPSLLRRRSRDLEGRCFSQSAGRSAAPPPPQGKRKERKKELFTKN